MRLPLISSKDFFLAAFRSTGGLYKDSFICFPQIYDFFGVKYEKVENISKSELFYHICENKIFLFEYIVLRTQCTQYFSRTKHFPVPGEYQLYHTTRPDKH